MELVTVDSPEAMAAAIGPKTALIYLVAGRGTAPGQPLSLENVVAIARPAGIPVLVDAAAENLTIPCVHLEAGADVVVYSGGKAMCGPQGAGLVLGRKDILQAAWQASSPHHGPGRDNKVSREEILGMLAAVEAWTVRDHNAEWQGWLDRLDAIAKAARQVPGVETALEQPAGLSNHSPTLVIRWETARLHLTGEEAAEDFARKPPRIAVGSSDRDGWSSIRITPSQMQPGDEEVVAERVHGLLGAARSPRPSQLVAPAADLNGHWEVQMDFFAGSSRHFFYLEQEGNWVRGSHHSDFSRQEIAGTVEGEQVKLRSRMENPGDHILFIFSGGLTDEGFAGSVFLGEYLTAHFTARRAVYGAERRPVFIPGGPPLAT